MAAGRSLRFRGEIAGFGTTSGHRVVVGRWPSSPFGPFADVMHEAPGGVRTLLAPSDPVAEFVAGTYTFDRVVVVPVTADRSADRLGVEAGDLVADLTTGTRTGLGWALRAVPSPVARAVWWCALIDPVARRVVRGVRSGPPSAASTWAPSPTCGRPSASGSHRRPGGRASWPSPRPSGRRGRRRGVTSGAVHGSDGVIGVAVVRLSVLRCRRRRPPGGGRISRHGLGW